MRTKVLFKYSIDAKRALVRSPQGKGNLPQPWALWNQGEGAVDADFHGWSREMRQGHRREIGTNRSGYPFAPKRAIRTRCHG